MGFFNERKDNASSSKHRSKGSRHPPPPPPPPPPPASSSARGAANPRAITSSSQSPLAITVGIETEFLLTQRFPGLEASTLRQFSRNIAAGYNQSLNQAAIQHPRMHNAVDQAFLGEQYSEWSLDTDLTIEAPKKDQAPWPLENISPKITVDAGNRWRAIITSMWRFLETSCTVSVNKSCGTHVHISTTNGWTVETLKRLCYSILHFEPAIEAIVPSDRRGNEYAKSNWIDNPNFARKNMSRRDSMALIERCQTLRDIVVLMHPGDDGFDKMYGWNITYINKSSKEGTAEFRRGSGSSSVSDCFMWMEFAISFAVSAINNGSIENLKKIPANVGGLKWFVEHAAQSSGPVQSFMPTDYLQRLFQAKPADMALQPMPVGHLSAGKANKLKRKKLEDKQRSIALAKMTNQPYW